MSTAVIESPQLDPADRLDVSGTPRTPMGRLVSVEVRKMIDTRAGLWLVISSGLFSLVVMAGMLIWAVSGDKNTIGLNGFIQGMSIPVGILLPVIAIMTITSEWSQRTGLATFTLEPHRSRLVIAKLITVLGLAVAALLLSVALGALGNVLYGALTDHAVSWNAGAGVLGGVLLTQVLTLLMGFGFGLLFLNTPAAITFFFVFNLVLPIMVYQAVMALTSWGDNVIPWIDLTTSSGPLTEGSVSGTEWGQVATSSLIFVALPLVLGVRRVLRTEVK